MSDHGKTARDGDADDVVERSVLLFDDSVQGLDGETRSRLNRARQEALAAASQTLPGTAWRRRVTAGAAATVAGILLLVWNVKEPANTGSASLPATDFEILVDQDNLEMLEELEFFSWMDDGDTADEHVG